MPIKSIFLFFTFTLSSISYAQQKLYTIEEAARGLKTSLAQKNLEQLHWIPNENAFAQVTTTPYGEALIKTQVPGLKTDTLLRSSSLNNQLFRKDVLQQLPDIQWLSDDECYFAIQNHYFIAFEEEGEWGIRPWNVLPETAENVFVGEDYQLAYTMGNNLYMVDRQGQQHQVTQDKDAGIVNGKIVHREEFGIDKGIFFSPKGNYLAYYRMDERMVEDYPVINWDTTPAIAHSIKYPFAGRTSHEVTLGVYNPKTRKTVYMKTGTPKDHYLTGITWNPDEQFIYIAILSREQNHLWLNQYDAQTGELLRTLFEETDPKYMHPQHGLTFLPASNEEFLWWSQRDGFMHLYRYNTEGNLLNAVTQGEWLVNEIVGFNPKKREVYVLTSKESPMEKHLYAVEWENGRMQRLDTDVGVHTATASSNGEYLIDIWSNGTTPRVVDLLSAHGKWKKNLLVSDNPLSAYRRPKVESVQLTADDGTPLYGKLIYPTPFDPSKKYPVIVYLYNGPNVQLLSNSFPGSGNLWYEYMAQRGYVVFTMDGRGSANRGLAFEQAVFRNLGTVEMADQMKGVEYLKSLPFVDGKRLGIHGWSFGGFMTTSFMLRKPDVFAVGVAGGPVMDWKLYEVMYTERYMDTPQENPQGYEIANLLTKSDQLQGKLLLIHGAQDSTVLWQHSMNFLQEAVKNRKQVDYYVYPDHEHNVRGADRVHLMQKISDYFDLYLKKQDQEAKLQ